MMMVNIKKIMIQILCGKVIIQTFLETVLAHDFHLILFHQIPYLIFGSTKYHIYFSKIINTNNLQLISWGNCVDLF